MKRCLESAGAHVLIIEDNPRIGDKLVEVLSRSGFRATLCRDGQAGLVEFENRRPDLVLVEHLVPGVEGGRVVDHLRRLDEEVPVVVMATSPQAQVRLLQHGPGFTQGFLLKPFRVPELLMALESALGSRFDGARPEPEAPISIAGELKGDALSSVLLTLLRQSATGMLRLERDGVRRDIYLLKGLPVFAESNLLSETFGRFLIARGSLSESQHADVLRFMRAQGVRQGEALVALGILNNQGVYALLRGQVRERVARCFTWDDARYAFYRDDRFIDDKLMFPMNPLTLLIDGVLRRHDSSALLSQLEALRTQRLTSTPVVDELKTFLDRVQRDPPLSEVIARSETVADLVDGLRLAATRAAAVLVVLRAAGAVCVDDDVLPEQSTLPGRVAFEYILDNEEQLNAQTPHTSDPAAEQVLARYLATRGGTHYAVLGLPRGADEAALEAAYLAICRDFHPDRFVEHPDFDVRLRAKEVFIKVGQAFGVLSDPRLREGYDAQLPAVNAVPSMFPVFDAEEWFRAGEAHWRKGELAAAKEAFARAHAARPEEPLYIAHYGRALFAVAGSSEALAEGEDLVRRAVSSDPSFAQAFRFLAEIHELTGRTDTASELKLRAQHLDARVIGDALDAEETSVLA